MQFTRLCVSCQGITLSEVDHTSYEDVICIHCGSVLPKTLRPLDNRDEESNE